MDIKKEIEQDPLSDAVSSQNEREFFHKVVTIKTNNDAVLLDDDCHIAVKTEIKSETPIHEHYLNQIKFEPVTCSNWEVDRKTEVEQQSLISDFGSQKDSEFLPEDPVIKSKKCNSDDEMDNRVEIKEEHLWLETISPSVYDDIEDGDFPAVRVTSSRFCAEAVPGTSSVKSPLSPSEESGRNTRFCNGEYHLEYEHQKSDVTEIPTAEEHFLSEEANKYSNVGEMHIKPLYLQQENLIHNGKRPHQCKTCNRSFTHLSNLKTHNLIHEGKKPHQCKTCDKRFTHLTNLKTHHLIHEGKRPHQCKTCSKSFTQLSALKKHNLIHEGIKPHQCKTCDKKFTQVAQLKTHELVHDGKKPHQCKTCDKRFTRLSAMKRHNLIHEGTKAYQCKTCNKTFSQLSHLKTHYLIHERKKPHQCKTCDKSFTQLSHLKRHYSIHEGKK